MYQPDELFPQLWRFFDGAFAANSGGKVRKEDFMDLSPDDCRRAEQELDQFCGLSGFDARKLGMMADSGYNVWGQTRQNDDCGDDDQHRLVAFDLLDQLY